MTSTTRPTIARTSRPRRRWAPARVAAAAILLLLALVGIAGTIRFGLFGNPPLVAWSVVAFSGFATLFVALPGLVRGRRWAWNTALCWAAAPLYWSLYKVLVEGETESLVGSAGLVVVLVLLLLPVGRPSDR